MPNYEMLSQQITDRIEADRRSNTLPQLGAKDADVLRRRQVTTDHACIWRPAYVHDIDKILHCPYYNRYSDKTQVFSLTRNDDITRRSLHVQLVSRIARTIGRALNLNLDLIEAIALGHDLGHPPYAHSGETFLDEIYNRHTGRHFSHSIQSVRVLDGIFPRNVSLQVLDGIACHNGEIELEEYRPGSITTFEQFDAAMERCYQDPGAVRALMPSTLEGAVVRISDIIAYLGKDRQDAAKMCVVDEDTYNSTRIGSINAEIINNLVVNIIENSYGKPYIRLDQEHFQAMKTAKKENYSRIYDNAASLAKLRETVKPMMAEVYDQMLEDLRMGKTDSPIFKHHVDYVNKTRYTRMKPYLSDEPNQIVVDYIASMTDDYFVDLHHYLFPDSDYRVVYTGYFDERGNDDV